MERQRKYIEVTKNDGIAWTMLNRPEKKNAMSPALHREMDATLDELEADPDVKVVVIGGKNGNFSSGQDLKEYFRALEGKPAEIKQAWLVSNRWQFSRLYMFDKPTIAMVEGYCIGGAFSHLLSMDFAIAASDAVFSLSEVNWGILPGGMVSKLFADAVSYRQALYYACLGDAFDGNEAVRIGIVNKAVPGEQLREQVTDLAKRLMSKSPAALRATKQVIRQVRQMDFNQAAEYLQAKKSEIKSDDPDNSYSSGLHQFLDKKSYSPVYEPFKRGPSDQAGH